MISFKHLAIVALCALPVAAHAAPKHKGGGRGGAARKGSGSKKVEAKKHINAATAAHEAGQFDIALRELQAAYELDPQPDLLYAIGQVQVKLDNCPEAIMSYEKFLETNPGPEPTTAAAEAIKTCQDQLAAQQPPPPPPPDPKPALPPPPPAEGKAFYKDPIGDGLVVVGVAASVTGVLFYLGARAKLDETANATTYADQRAIVDEARSKRNLAVIIGGAGVAVLSIGVWRWTRVGNRGEQQRVALVPRGDGGMITWGGSF